MKRNWMENYQNGSIIRMNSKQFSCAEGWTIFLDPPIYDLELNDIHADSEVQRLDS